MLKQLPAKIFVILLLTSFICPVWTQDANTASSSEEEGEIILSEAELLALVEKAVSKKVRPLQREISALKEEVRFHDILGGIGYILGLAGVAFYFLAKKDRATTSQNVKKSS